MCIFWDPPICTLDHCHIKCYGEIQRGILFYQVLSQYKMKKIIAVILIFGTVMTVYRFKNQDFRSSNQLPQEFQHLQYDDALLLGEVRKQFIDPPSHENYNLKFDENNLDIFGYNVFTTYKSYDWCTKVIKALFEDRPAGFFVEAGALDGEFLSNTLYLEKQLGWTGLLVEANDESYKELLTKHRKAWSSSTCLATEPHSHQGILTSYSNNAEMVGLRYAAHAHGSLFENTGGDALDGSSPGVVVYKPVQCIPLGTLLMAINITHVDFISLDVEGAEMGILNNFPWGKITVDVWLVEHQEPQSEKEESVNKKIDERFIEFFNEKGYILHKVSSEIPTMNYVFVKDTYNINIRSGAVL